MSRLKNQLTIKALAGEKLKKPGLFADGDGLYLQVGPTGARSWVYRYKVQGKQRTIGLGPLDKVGLVEARALAAEQARLRMAGSDPLAAKRQAKVQRQAETRAADQAAAVEAEAQGRTFKTVALAYIEARAHTWAGPKQKPQWTASLENHAFPKIGHLPVDQIGIKEVLSVLEPIWQTIPETADRVRSRIERVLAWAKAEERKQSNSLPAPWANPATLRGNLDSWLTHEHLEVKHLPAMAFDHVPAFVGSLTLAEGTAALALRFCILTATRTNETLGATWGEIDIEKRLWIIPAARMKGRKGKKREHRVPLSPAALAVLDKAKDFGQAPDAPVFPGQRSDGHLSNMAFLALLHRRGLDVTAHGFRSSFSTWASETTDHAREVVEMSLAHAIPNAVEAAYRRGSLLAKRTALMEDWGRYCTRRKAAMRKR